MVNVPVPIDDGPDRSIASPPAEWAAPALGLFESGLLARLARVCLGLYLIGAPIIVWIPPIPGLETNPLRILGLIVFVLGMLFVVTSSRGVRFQKPLTFTIALPFMAVTIAWGLYNHPISAVLYETFPLLVFIGAWGLLRSSGARIGHGGWLTVLALSGGIAGLIALANVTGAIAIPTWREGIADRFENLRTAWVADSLSGVIGQLAATMILMTERRRSRLWLAATCFGLSWTCIALGEFRAYILIAGALFAGCFLHQVTVRNWRRVVAVGGAATLVVLLVVASNPLDRVSRVSERFLYATDHIGLTGYQSDLALNRRSTERSMELELARERPLVGFGWGLSGSIYMPFLGSEFPLHGHSLYTSALARFGFVLGTLYIVWWFSLAFRAWSFRRRARRTGDALWAHVTFLTASAFLVVAVVQDVSKISVCFPAFAVFWALPHGEAPLSGIAHSRAGRRSR